MQKNIVNRFYKTASSSRFLCHQFHIKKVISESKPSCHITIFPIIVDKKTYFEYTQWANKTHHLMTFSSFLYLTFVREANKHIDNTFQAYQQKKPSRIILKVFLRCVRDSNSWPPAWQAGILTNWTNAPIMKSNWMA